MTVLFVFLVILAIGILAGVGYLINKALDNNKRVNELKSDLKDLRDDNDIFQTALSEILVNPDNSASLAINALNEARTNNRSIKGGF